MKNELILITGAARSGTSMTAGLINICGAYGGEMSGATLYNQKGMFENSYIRDQITKPYLKKIGCDPKGQKPLPSARQVFCIDENDPKILREKVLKAYERQGYENGPVFLKQAKICLIWYLWHKAFPDSKWLIVRRNKKDIVNSCLKTVFMSAYRDAKGWEKWVEAHELRFRQMKIAGLKTKEIWPQKIIEGDHEELKEVLNWLELKYDEKMVRAFVEPALWKQKNVKRI